MPAGFVLDPIPFLVFVSDLLFPHSENKGNPNTIENADDDSVIVQDSLNFVTDAERNSEVRFLPMVRRVIIGSKSE